MVLITGCPRSIMGLPETDGTLRGVDARMPVRPSEQNENPYLDCQFFRIAVKAENRLEVRFYGFITCLKSNDFITLKN